MSDVLYRAPRNLVSFIESRGVATPEIFSRVQSLAPNDPYLEQQRLMTDPGRLPWTSFSVFCDAILPYFSKAEDYEAYTRFANFQSEGWTAYAKIASLALIDFAKIYPFTIRVMHASTFGDAVHATIEHLPERRFRVRMELGAGRRENLHFFRMCRYGLAAMPEIFGQPAANVDAEYNAHEGLYEITAPPSQTPWARFLRALRRGFSYRTLSDEMAQQDRSLREGYRRLQRSVDDLERAKAELESRVESRTRELHEANARSHASMQTAMATEREYQAVGDTAGRISHRLGNAIQGLLFSLDRADRRTLADHAAKENLKTAMAFAERAREAVGDLAAFSREARSLGGPQQAFSGEAPLEMDGGDEKILIVDADADLLGLLADTLRTFGYEVQTTLDGDEALDLIDKQRFNLVVTDGIELAHAIRERQPSLPLVFCTEDSATDREELRMLFQGIIGKPIDAYKLNEAIRRSLVRA